MLEPRVTRIFTSFRTARMVKRSDLAEGYSHVRIDAAVKPQEGEPRFYVLADTQPITGVHIAGAIPLFEFESGPPWTPPESWGIRVGEPTP